MNAIRFNTMRAGGFTLVELLVVAAIIALLIGTLLPSYSEARKHAKAVLCLSRQRQIALAMHAYTQDYAGSFPIAYYTDEAHGASVAWDTITYFGDSDHARPGLIWQYAAGGKVQQCPSYAGESNTPADRYTGYNYNTTYIGRGQGEAAYRGMTEAPTRLSEIRPIAQTALIGDGGYRGGANKFMRAPLDPNEGLAHAGAQAYRHGDRTNVAHVDGHGTTVAQRFRKLNAHPWNEHFLDWPKNGFLSDDDRAYAVH